MKIFHLSEPRHGWINVTFGYEGDSFTIDSVSDVPNDCLADLAVATLRLLASSSSHELVEFSLEPDYAKCHLSREGEDLRIRIEMPRKQEAAYEATLPLDAFARRLRFELLRIRPAYSDEAGWSSFYFPEFEVAALGKALNES